MKLAIFSSWSSKISISNKKLAYDIGRYLALRNVTIITGGCSGIPALCIEAAYAAGAKTIGYFPYENKYIYTQRQHEKNIHDISYYTEINFTEGFTARSLDMIKSSDAAIALNGRVGTMSEIGIAIEEKLPVGIITGAGGICDEMKNILNVCEKTYSDNHIIINSDYEKVIDMMIDRIS